MSLNILVLKLPNAVSHFITEREGLIHKYSKEGGEVELRPNEVEGFEHTTILHFANPAFAMVCQEILLLFPFELLELLRPGHGILSSVGAMVRAFEFIRSRGCSSGGVFSYQPHSGASASAASLGTPSSTFSSQTRSRSKMSITSLLKARPSKSRPKISPPL